MLPRNLVPAAFASVADAGGQRSVPSFERNVCLASRASLHGGRVLRVFPRPSPPPRYPLGPRQRLTSICGTKGHVASRRRDISSIFASYHRPYFSHSCGNTSSSSFSQLKRLHFLVIMLPAAERVHSDYAEVACTGRYLQASFSEVGTCASIMTHY